MVRPHYCRRDRRPTTEGSNDADVTMAADFRSGGKLDETSDENGATALNSVRAAGQMMMSIRRIHYFD